MRVLGLAIGSSGVAATGLVALMTTGSALSLSTGSNTTVGNGAVSSYSVNYFFSPTLRS